MNCFMMFTFGLVSTRRKMNTELRLTRLLNWTHTSMTNPSNIVKCRDMNRQSSSLTFQVRRFLLNCFSRFLNIMKITTGTVLFVSKTHCDLISVVKETNVYIFCVSVLRQLWIFYFFWDVAKRLFVECINESALIFTPK